MEAERFIFESYQFRPKKREIIFKYSLDDEVHFEEVLRLPKMEVLQVEEELLERILFNLHLMVGISYYKTYCPKKIEVKSGVLSRKEADFWNKLYTQGLGEFFYQNNLEFKDLVNFPFEDGLEKSAISVDLPEKSLLPLGGGKDSLVAAEILRERGHEFEIFNLGGHKVVENLSKKMDKEPIVVKRELSKELFRLNDEGALNGHVPISAYLAFLSVLLGVLYGFKYIVLANERSANEGNVHFKGAEINHQYSKSYEFEKDLTEYLSEFVTPSIRYFSLLRPYYEIEIAKKFATYEQYFDSFTSCNRNFKIHGKSKQLWCGECAKCAFVFTMFAPFIEKDRLIAMFGKNMFADEQLWPLFEELLGLADVKPFDCVGTAKEVRYAMTLAAEKTGDVSGYKSDYIIQKFLDARIGQEELDLFDFHGEHNIPVKFLKSVVVGYGREGRAVESYLKEIGGTVDVVDQKDDVPDYLANLDQYEAIIKSPGVPWWKAILAVGDRVTSATQIFFDELDPSNRVIGVTGSKGKSTTASLIYEILKAAGKDVLLVGNIGEPAINHIEEKNKIFVMEMSSYQLDRLEARPHVAVWTSFFPEHLNVHGNLENYLKAKTNIVRHQRKNDFFLYHKRDKEILDNIKTDAERLVLDKLDGPLHEFESKLPGKHNQENIALCFAVGKIFNVDEELMRKVIANFEGLPHRLQELGEFKGIRFVDDAISTTPESTLAAIDIFGDEIGTIMLGGEDRGYDFKELGQALSGNNIENLVVFPDSGDQILSALPEGYSPNILETDNMTEAVDFAFKNTQEGKVCLLSTASPSYSLWKNFEEKGDEFQKIVRSKS